MNAPTKIDDATREAYRINRTAIDRSHGFERARQIAASLPSADRLALAIHLIDYLDGVDDDARNEAVDVLGELVR